MANSFMTHTSYEYLNVMNYLLLYECTIWSWIYVLCMKNRIRGRRDRLVVRYLQPLLMPCACVRTEKVGNAARAGSSKIQNLRRSAWPAGK